MGFDGGRARWNVVTNLNKRWIIKKFTLPFACVLRLSVVPWLEVIVSPGCVCFCGPSVYFPVAFAIPEELKLRLVQHLAVKIIVCKFAGLSPRRRCQTSSVHSLPESSSLLSDLDKYFSRYWSAVHGFQIWVPILVLIRLSTSAALLLFRGQAISLAHKITRVGLKRFYSPELHVIIIPGIQRRWQVFAGRQGIWG